MKKIDLDKRNDSFCYGQRLIVESVFSALRECLLRICYHYQAEQHNKGDNIESIIVCMVSKYNYYLIINNYR